MTDVFYGIGNFCQWIFKGMKVLGHGPNIIMWAIIVFLIGYQVVRMMKENKEAERNGTLK
ncbi:MAG: hypothetical protein IT237_00465 [Bacteroidia bacterium]|nr:hypothetical protein [Bacteroidia bacterium]